MEGKQMNGRLIATGILTLAFAGVGTAYGAVASGGGEAHTSPAQLKKMAHEAHTPEQYKALAVSYDIQQKDYLKQAADEKQEWIRRSQITVSLYAKYPKPADEAKYLYEYYVEKASEAGALSAKYAQLAEPSGAATQQRM
jgi:hypothetical protein